MSDPVTCASEPGGPPSIGSAEPPPLPPAPGGGIPARRAFVIVLAYFAVQVAVGVFVGLVVGMYFAITRGPLTGEVLAAFQRVAVMPATALSAAAGGLVAFAMARRDLPGAIREGALRPIGWRSATGGQAAAAACLGPVLVAFYVFVLFRAFPPGPAHKWGPIAQAAMAGGWQRVLWAFLVLCVAPPVEEFLFRGVLWSSLARGMKPVLAGAAVTALFVLAHFPEARGYWPAWLLLSAVGTLAVYLRARTDSLVPPLVLHTGYNAAMVALAYLGRT